MLQADGSLTGLPRRRRALVGDSQTLRLRRLLEVRKKGKTDFGRKQGVARNDLRSVFSALLHHSHVDNVTHIEVAAVIEE